MVRPVRSSRGEAAPTDAGAPRDARRVAAATAPPRASCDPGAPLARRPLSAGARSPLITRCRALCFRTKRSAALTADGAPASAAAILDNLLPERCVAGANTAQRPPGLQVLTRRERWVRRKLNEAFTAAEVARHCTPDDCWLIIKGNVYDVSGWGESHPGGKVVYTYGGRVRQRCTRSLQPATQALTRAAPTGRNGRVRRLPRRRHVAAAARSADRRVLRRLARAAAGLPPPARGDAGCTHVPEQQAVLRVEVHKQPGDLRRLAQHPAPLLQLHRGFCRRLSHGASPAHNAHVRVTAADRLRPQALFWQQCGWLAHDFLHHQVRPFAPDVRAVC